MKISKKSLAILENFCNINKSIYLDEPGYIKTISPMKTVIGLAKIEEEFPTFAIYDLNRFVNVIRMFDSNKEVEFEFNDKSILITQDKTSVTYFYSNPDHIFERTKPYENYFANNEFKGSFRLTDTMLQGILKASKIMDLNEIKFTMKDGKGTVNLIDSANSAANKYNLEIEGTGECNCTLFSGNINFIKSEYYDVFFFKSCVRFTSGDLSYILLNKAD